MKPHRQSAHQVGYAAPPSTEVSTRLLVSSVASVVVLLLLLNLLPEPAQTSCAAPAQVSNQK
jgi:hypothetical protein